MSITRRQALGIAGGCGLTTAGVDEKPAAAGPPKSDPVLRLLTPAARKVFEDTFPGHRCIRLARRGKDEDAVYRGTFFDPANWAGATVELIGGESVVTPPLFHLEVDAGGKVLEETIRPIDPKRLPKAVLAEYDKWNPKGVTGREHFWLTEVPRGKGRVYRVQIILIAVKSYRASFREDGSIVKAEPAFVP